MAGLIPPGPKPKPPSRPAWLDRMIEAVFAVSFASIGLELASVFGLNSTPQYLAAAFIGGVLGFLSARRYGASLVRVLRR